jgi:PAS domain S-box-containing protein
MSTQLSTEMSQTLLDNSLVGIYVAQDGKLCYVNSAFLELTGYQASDVLARDPRELVYPEDRLAAEARVKNILRQDIGSVYEYRIVTKSQNLRWVRETLVECEYQGRPAIAGYLVDISEEKASLAAGKQLLDNVWLGVIRTTPSGRFLSVNPAFCYIIGYTEAELLDMSAWELYVEPEERDTIVREMSGATGKMAKEMRWKRKDGAEILILDRFTADRDQNGNVRYYDSIIEDITDRKRVERELEQKREQLEVRNEELKTALETLRVSEERFRHLTELIGDWIWEIDGDVVFTYASPGVKSILGYEPEEIIGRRAEDFMTKAEARSFGTEFWKRLMATGQPMVKVRNVMRHKDGHQVILESSAIPFYDDDGRLLGYRGLDHDITERERIENEMRFLSSVTQQVTDSIVITDTSYRITYVNAATEDLFGYRSGELIGKSPEIFNAEPQASEIQQDIYARVSSGETWFGEIKGKRKDGSTLQCECKVSPLHDEQGQITSYIGIQRDVTERRRIQEALIVSEARLNEAQSIAHIGSWDWDVAKNEISHSEECERVMGRPVSNFEVFLDCVHPDDREYVEKSISAALRAGSPYETDYRVSLPSGEERVIHEQARATLDDSGRSIRMAGTVQDITEHKRAEDALRESEERFRDLVESSPDMIWEVDTDGVSRYISPEVRSLMGFEPEDLVGKNVGETHIFDPRSLDQFLSLIKTGNKVSGFICVQRHKDGHDVIVESSWVPVLDNDGHLIGCRGIDRDITERTKAEETLRKSEEKFYKAFHHTSNLMAISTVKGGRVIDINDAYARLYGYKREEIIGHTTLELGLWADPKQRKAVMKKLQEEGRVHDLTVAMRTKSGEIRTILFSADTITLKDEPCLIHTAIDITERERSLAKLRESEDRYATLVEQGNDGIVTLYQDGVLRFVNSKMVEMTGFSKKEMLGRPFTDYVAPEYRAVVSDCYQKRISGKPAPRNYEIELLAKDGSRIPAEISATRIEYGGKPASMGIIRDVTERKRVEKALQESEEKYHHLFDNLNDAVIIADVGTGMLIEANREATRLLGRSRNEIIGMHQSELHTSEMVGEYRKGFAQHIQQGRIVDYEGEVVRKDGQVVPVNISAATSTLRGRQIVTGIFRDITESKLAEEALRESEIKFRSLAEKSPNMIYINKKGKIVYANERCAELTGYTRDEFYAPDFDFLQLISPQHRKLIRASFTRHTKGEDVRPYEYTLVTKDGRQIAVINTTKLIDYQGESAILGIVTDISERKRAEEQLRRAAGEWRETFDSISDMISIIDRELRVARMNKAFADFVNMQPQEVIGKHCYELFHKTDTRIAGCPFEAVLSSKKLESVEFFDSQRGRYLDVTVSPILDEAGEVTSVVHVVRDVTERVKMQERLILTDRLASVGELASGVAHELNNPLTGVIGLSQLLTERGVPQDIREDLDLIYSEAQRAANIVKNLLTFARRHQPAKELLNINDVIGKVLELRAYEERVNNIEAVIHLAADLPRIMADYFQLQQVFLNIIINAEHFMIETHGRGTLTITTKRVGDGVSVSISDDGPGISQDDLGHIFDPFFTTKEVGKGTGLGLSICHGIVSAHGGQIFAESELGSGATFVVELPLNREEPQDE